MLLLPVNRGGGGNRNGFMLQPTAVPAPWEPSPPRAGCCGYTPEGPSLPAPEPPGSPQSLLLQACVPGEGGVGSQIAGPLPPGVPRQGTRLQRLCLHWGGFV